MPIKGIFMRFNGFSYRGWYQYTTFLFQWLKSPENALKRGLSIFYNIPFKGTLKSPFKIHFQNTFQRHFQKTSHSTPPKERPQRAFSCVLTAFFIEGGINTPPFYSNGLNRLKTPLNAVVGFFTRGPFKNPFKNPFQDSLSTELSHPLKTHRSNCCRRL